MCVFGTPKVSVGGARVTFGGNQRSPQVFLQLRRRNCTNASISPIGCFADFLLVPSIQAMSESHLPGKNLLVTAASSAYFTLVRGLVQSIFDRGPRASAKAESPRLPLDVKVIDLGLSESQVVSLSEQCEVLRHPTPYIGVEREDHSRAFLLSRSVRAFLPRYFPGYSTYLWFDADTWLQSWSAIDWLLKGAAAEGLAIVPSLDRAYGSLYDKTSLHYTWMQPIMKQAYGKDVARRLKYLPVLNSGVFAATADSEFWSAFAESLVPVFERCDQVRDQPALNVAVYRRRIPFYPLPTSCNWLCVHRLPRLDTQRWQLTKPLVPCEPLQVIHLTARFTGRPLAVACHDGSTRHLCLDYLAWRAASGFFAELP